MNERIRELAELATLYTSDVCYPDDPDWHETRDQRFAELIVRQCVKSTIALQNTAIDNKWELDETFHIIVDDMVEQFDMQHIFQSDNDDFC
jgi:hypothetical protein